ncbi:MAG TPA: adenylate/guanylate cyclase domain-containing protein [Candidatus Baltobacteraceae bacterium]
MTTILPTGTLTFLFTDIEGSTRLWERYPSQMRQVLARHDALVADLLERNAGYVFKTVGDAFCCAFSDPIAALTAAVAIQKAVAAEPWEHVGELRVRIAINTGIAQIRDGDYFGTALNRTARLLSLVGGGQIVLSQSTQRLVREELPPDIGLSDLGEAQLKDLQLSERAYQLTYPELATLSEPLVPISQTPNNLPEELSTFVGRKAELQRLRKLVIVKRLVTLMGPGGVGKTRLALHLAREVGNAFSGGVYFVELATLADAAHIPHAMLSAMQIHPSQPDLVTEIVRAISDRPTLVILDNSEQFAVECARLVRRLLEACPTLTIVATSREPLKVTGEYGFSVAPLAVPDAAMPLDQLRRCESVRLFADRASAVKLDFKIAPGNAEAVAAICRRLDGIPLALELAASRLRTLSAQQILDRLTERFALLTGGDRTGLDHHRSLRSTIDWSFDLLSEEERQLFVRLAIFHGPFTLEAAEAICGTAPLSRGVIVDVLTALVEKSFVTVFERETIDGYRLLDTLRAYADERLETGAEVPALAAAHLQYYRCLILALPAAKGEAQNAALDALEATHADVDAALDWALRNAVDGLAELALALVAFWQIRSFLIEGVAYLEAVVRVLSGSPICGRLYTKAAMLANTGGDYAEATRLGENARRLYDGQDDRRGLSETICVLASIQMNSANYARAEELFSEALATCKETDDIVGAAQMLLNLGTIATALEHFAEAEERLRECLELAAQAGDTRFQAWAHGALGYCAHQSERFGDAMREYEICLRSFRSFGDKGGIATVLNHLGEVALMGGDVARARACLHESLQIGKEHHLSLQLADSLELAARLCANDGAELEAARLVGAVDGLRERVHFPFTDAERRVRERYIEELRLRRPGDWFDRERAAGAKLDLDSAAAIWKVHQPRKRTSV